MNNPKSAMTAGALGIILGAFGAHDWYLGDTTQARKHVRLFIIGAAMLATAIVLRTIAPIIGQPVIAHILTSIAAIFNVFGWLVLLADVVWGIIAGILLLAGGDRALAAQGYIVAPTIQHDANGNINPNATPVAVPTLPTVQTTIQSTPVSTPTTPDSPPQTQSAQPATPYTTLPPAPTLAEQGSNTQVDRPVVFHASDIPAHTAAAFGQPGISTAIPTGPIVTDNVSRPGVNITKDHGRIPVWARRLIVIVIAVASVGILAAMIKGGIDSTLAVAYQESYRAAKALLPEIKAAHDSSSCAYAVEYARAATVDRATYNGYISTCKNLLTGTRELVDQLGATSIVRTDSEISTEYDSFLEAYDSVFVDEATAAEISSALDLYQAWHTYLLLADRLTVTSPDREFQQAADILRTSGNQVLANYGEDWLHRELDYLTAYRTYQEMSYTDPAKESARLALDAQLAELDNWVTDHRPNVLKLAPYTAPDTTAMYQSFTKLYEAIKAGYEAHYDRKTSNDCTVAGDKVYCQ